MDELIQRLLQMTREISGRLPDVGYEELAEFVDNRGSLVGKLQQANSDSAFWVRYRNEVESMEQLTPLFLKRMEELKEEARTAIGRTIQARKQRSAYEQDYESDSLLFDRKK